MISVEQVKGLSNLKDVDDGTISAVLPGARSMIRSRMGKSAYKEYSETENSDLLEELQLAEIYYAISLLPTSLLQIHNNGVLVGNSQWGEGKETHFGFSEIKKLKDELVLQANGIVDNWLQERTNRTRSFDMRVI